MEDWSLAQGAALSAPHDSLKTLGRPASIRERAKLAVEQAERRLADVKRAQEILEQHPELEELLNIMNRNNF